MPGTANSIADADGHNHAGGGRATAAPGRRGVLRLLGAAALADGGPAAAQDDPLVQRGVPAEATAENAVVARDRALAAGQRIAYQRMAEAMGLTQRPSDQQIEDLVQSLVIESERITPRGYVARITVNFSPQQVAALTGGRGAAPAAPPAATGPAVATIEALALYASLPEWVEITRRLRAAPVVARTEILGISGQAARLRLSLRAAPAEAAAGLSQGGIALAQATGFDPRPGEGWRLALAGGR